MEISDIRVKLIHNAADRLKAVCTVTFDSQFVVRDVKVVEGTNGLFVAMPSRKLTIHCPKCRSKNPFRARFCSECGVRIPATKIPDDADGRSRLHRDIAHPITGEFRELLQQCVIEAFESEQAVAVEPPHDTDIDRHDTDRHDAESEAAKEGSGSDYDNMIAGLDGGGAGRAERKQRGRGGRRESGPAKSDRSSQRRTERPVPQSLEPTASTTTDTLVREEEEDREFGTGLEEERDKEVVTRPEPIADRETPVKPEQRSVDTDKEEEQDDEDTAFGEGIL